MQGTGGAKTARVTWTPECEASFQALKQELLQAPILAFADFGLPFRLYTDASLHGLGAVLAQVQGDKERVIAYASRSLHPGERNDQNYSSFKLEFLGLKWAIIDKFKDYLWGVKFHVFTDNRLLVHLQTANLGATEQRWAAQLANYDFTIHYRPGTSNQNADALSRMPEEVTVAAVHVSAEQEAQGSSTNPVNQEDVSWGQRQSQDRDLALLLGWKLRRERPSTDEQQALSLKGRSLLKDWERLTVEEGKLMRCGPGGQFGAVPATIVVPTAYQKEVWAEYHQALGHARGTRLMDALKERVYWLGMGQDSQNWSLGCQECILGRSGPDVRAPLQPIVCQYPFEMVSLDYLSLGREHDTYPCILVMTDLFSIYVVAVPTRDQTT